MTAIQPLTALLGAAALLLAGPVRGDEVLDWRKCLEETARINPSLAAARAQVDQAAESLRETRADLLPQISGRASWGYSKSSGSEAGNSYSYSLSGSQLIFDGLETWYRTGQKQLSLLSARYSYILTSASVRRDLDLAFIDLVEAQDLLAISLDIEGRRRQQAEMVSLRYQAGREHRGSLLAAEANLASATLDVKIARRRFDLAQTNLARAIGRDESGALEAAGDLATPPEMPAPKFPELVREHPDVLRQEASLESADYNLKIARAGFFPSISGSGSIGRSGDDWPPGKESWGVGVSLSLPIFTGGSRLANIAGATAALEESRQNTRKTSQDTLYSLEQAWKNFEDAREEVRIQDLYLAADTERARISEAQYAIGLLSFDNWIIIEDNLVRTKKSHLTSRAGSRRTLARWLYARALTLEDDLRSPGDSDDILN